MASIIKYMKINVTMRELKQHNFPIKGEKK